MSACDPGPPSFRKLRLLRCSRKSRQLADVAQVVLNDHGRVEVRGDLLHPLERRDRLRAVVVEGRHAVRFVVLVEVRGVAAQRSEEHTSELQSRLHLVCRLLLEKKKTHRLMLGTELKEEKRSATT